MGWAPSVCRISWAASTPAPIIPAPAPPRASESCARLKSAGNARALPALMRRTRIALAEGGADAGVIGAAVLAAQEVAASSLRDTPATQAVTTERAE